MTLPGNLTDKQMLERMIRVDQAGEYGAKRIYAGQLAVLKGKASEATIRHMAEQEQQHLDYFNDAVRVRAVRPTALQPLWHVGGWMLGAASALLGEKAAMACTVAVESVIDEHYAKQSNWLATKPDEATLKNTIDQFRAEEMEHHDTALDAGAEQSPFYHLLTTAIRSKTKLSIWLSERI
jgi:ubiquinone biosynthesis monooxygenase Coq7